jgi:hypothetical protein
MATSVVPVISAFYDMLYGTAGVDLNSLCLLPMGASGMVFSGNPPYHLADFLAMYPKFFGPSTYIKGLAITTGSAVISGFSAADIANIKMGQYIANYSTDCIDVDTVVLSVDTIANTVTMTQVAIDDGTDLLVYETPVVPLVIMQTFATLAEASVMQARYCEAWPFMMALFIAHYLTMYLRTENVPPGGYDPNNPYAYISQVASGGLTKGILVHRAAGDVSATNQLIQGYEQWGAWAETQYGELFITIARATCMGPVWVP